MSKSTNKMGVIQLTFLTAINMMGSGIIMLPAKLAQVGTMSVLSWLVTALGSVTLAYSFAQCGMNTRKGGGMGGYAEYSFGKSGAFMTNYTYGVSLLIANAAIAISVVGYAFVLWLATVLNFWGAKFTGRLGSITIWGVIIPVLLLGTIGWFWFKPALYVSSWNPNHLPLFSGIGQSITITLWAFLGLESACANMDAVENPKRNVPIAVLGGTLGVGLIYILSTSVMQGIVPNSALLNSNAPFGLTFATLFGPAVGRIIIAMMVISCFGSLFAWQFTIAEVFRSSSVEGYFPKIFEKVTKKETPVVGMVIITIVQTILSLMTISPTLNSQFITLVNLAVVTNLIPYLLSMAALNVIQKSSDVTDSKIKSSTIVAFVASIYSLYACYASGSEAMLYGGVVTFAGWTLYGFISKRFDLKKAEENKEKILSD
jgi:putrescine:ornithine antiporter